MSSFTSNLGRELDDLASVQKKLGASWSSWSGGRMFNSSLLRDVAAQWHTLEKKVKMRCLISLIGLDLRKRTECSEEIKHLLAVAHNGNNENGDGTADTWVAVIAGLVNERLFSDDTSPVSSTAKNTLVESSDDIVKYLLNQIEVASDSTNTTTSSNDMSAGIGADSLEEIHAFQPHEVQYMSGTKNHKQSNPHFAFHGTIPNILSKIKAHEAKAISGSAPSNSSIMGTNHAQATAANSSSSASVSMKSTKTTTHSASFLLQRNSMPTSRVPAKTMSMSDLINHHPIISVAKIEKETKEAKAAKIAAEKEKKEQEKAAEKLRKEQEREAKKKEKADAAAAIAAQKEAAAKERAEAFKAKRDAAAAQLEANPAAPIPISHISIPVQVQEQAQLRYNFPKDLPVLYETYPNISREDQVSLATFFSPSWQEMIPDSAERPIHRVLLHEQMMKDPERNDVIVGKTMLYMCLKYSDHTWEVQQGYQPKKAKT